MDYPTLRLTKNCLYYIDHFEGEQRAHLIAMLEKYQADGIFPAVREPPPPDYAQRPGFAKPHGGSRTAAARLRAAPGLREAPRRFANRRRLSTRSKLIQKATGYM